MSAEKAETTAAPAKPRHARNSATELGHAEPRGGQRRDSNRCHAEPRSTRREEKAASTPSSALSASPRANLSGWQSKTLGDVCHVYQPETISQKQMVPGDYPVYGANGQIGTHDQFNHEDPQLILGCRGTCGAVHFTERKSWINGNAMVVQPKDGMIDRAFLAYALRGGVDIAAAITGAAQPQITRTSLMPISISFPESLPEQRRIVGILDEALAGIAAAKAHAERNRQNARGLFESHLHAVFSHPGPGWTEKPFEDLIESNLIGLTRSSREQGDDRRYPYVKMNHITRENRFDFSEYVNVDATPEEAERFALRAGDFLFNTRNSHELVGKSCIYDGPADGTVLFNNNIMRVRFRSGVEARFVLLAFSSREVTAELEAMKSGTTNVAAIYYKDLRTLSIPLPPFREQQRIANQLDALAAETRRLEGLYERKAAALDELKQSLLHQAFSGQL